MFGVGMETAGGMGLLSSVPWDRFSSLDPYIPSVSISLSMLFSI